MTAPQIFDIFKSANRDLQDQVEHYKEVNGKPNQIRLWFSDGRRGRFEVQRGHFKLILVDEDYKGEL